MQKLDFGEALEVICKRDHRYAPDAYYFLRDALDHTIKQRKKAKEGSGHVNGRQLLDGLRQYALKQFGPMVVTVFNYWGVHRCDDFGEMVFNLIDVGIFGRTESDSIEDFRGGYNFADAFVTPFLPSRPTPHLHVRSKSPAEELL